MRTFNIILDIVHVFCYFGFILNIGMLVWLFATRPAMFYLFFN